MGVGGEWVSSGLIAITGISGFVGGYLRRLLELNGVDFRPVNLRGLDRISLQIKVGQLELEGAHSLVNLGWSASSTEDYKRSKENLDASEFSTNVGLACLESGVRFFGIGSPAEFFPEASQYGRSKRDCRDKLQPLIDSGQMTWLRPHYVFDSNSWPKIVGDAALGRRVGILDDSARSFIHVEDVAEAIMAAVSRGLTGEIDILYDKLVRPSELLAALGYPFEVLGEMQRPIYPGELGTASLMASGWLPKKTKEVLESH